MNMTHTNRACISSNNVQGTDVYDLKGNEIGEIDHLIIEKVSGKVIYGILSFGGFIGLGKSHYPIPWSKLRYNQSLEGYQTDINEEQLRDAPQYSDSALDDRNWEDKVHSYYGVPPYWS